MYITNLTILNYQDSRTTKGFLVNHVILSYDWLHLKISQEKSETQSIKKAAS